MHTLHVQKQTHKDLDRNMDSSSKHSQSWQMQEPPCGHTLMLLPTPKPEAKILQQIYTKANQTKPNHRQSKEVTTTPQVKIGNPTLKSTQRTYQICNPRAGTPTSNLRSNSKTESKKLHPTQQIHLQYK
eukprot:gene3199-2181_t